MSQRLGGEQKLVLRIDPRSFRALSAHAEEIYPNECCGVLLGHFGDAANTVTAVVACSNGSQDSPQNRYSIAPLELVRIQQRARNQGLDIVGFYHSHPDNPAQWSTTDLAEAYWLRCSYVITSVSKGTAAETRSFRLTGFADPDLGEKQFEEESIETTAQTQE